MLDTIRTAQTAACATSLLRLWSHAYAAMAGTVNSSANRRATAQVLPSPMNRLAIPIRSTATASAIQKRRKVTYMRSISSILPRFTSRCPNSPSQQSYGSQAVDSQTRCLQGVCLYLTHSQIDRNQEWRGDDGDDESSKENSAREVDPLNPPTFGTSWVLTG